MAERFDWRQNPPEIGIEKASQALRADQCVIFPTDTSYAVAARAASVKAVQRLTELPNGETNSLGLSLGICPPGQTLTWVPQFSTIGRRFIRRSWPGPLILSVPKAHTSIPTEMISQEVQSTLLKDERLHLCCPSHDAILHVLQGLNEPVLLKTWCRSDGTEITNADEVTNPADIPADLIIDNGATYFKNRSTIVFLNEDKWTVCREGVIKSEMIATLVGCQIVFVCTGNTCRSPLCEGLFKKLLAYKLECTPEELPARGFFINSAGIAAHGGDPASPDAVEVAHNMGVDLSGHRSQPLSNELFHSADRILTLTNNHLAALRGLTGPLGANPELLCRDGRDITDPIGQDREVYKQCAEQILHCLNDRLKEFV